jgi:hypothetical protein
MIRRLIFIVAVLLAVPSVSPAAKYATLVGGSSSHADERPGFRKNFETLNRGLVARGWKTQILFADGDGKLPAKAAANPLIQAAVDELADTAQTGDEVLYFFCGHGGERAGRRGRGRSPELTHALQTENERFFSFDNLSDDLKTLQSKNVRVAVVDLSCFSGSTQVVEFTSRACVVTLAATRYVSQCGTYDRTGFFTQRFVKLPELSKQRDVSLLDQFLAARVADPESANFAQISCIVAPAADAWQNLWHDTDPANERRADTFDGRPVNPLRFNRIANSIKDNRVAIADACAKLIADTPDPKRKDQFQKLGEDLAKRLDEFVATHEELERACGDIRTTLSRKMDWGFAGPAARFNKQNYVDMKQMITDANAGVAADDYKGRGRSNRDLYAAVLADRKRLRGVLDDLNKDLGDAWSRYEKLTDSLNRHGEDVMKAERKFYDLYARSTPLDDAADCKAFKF